MWVGTPLGQRETPRQDAMTEPDKPDHAGVVAPPPVIFGTGLALGLAAEWMMPSGLVAVVDSNARTAVAAGLIVLSLGLAGVAVVQFRRARTHLEPWRPTAALITGGIYRLSRNPIYVALALLYAGIAVAAASGWALALLVPVLLVMEFGVVRREERYLEAKFGETYRAYRARVRRWF